MKLYREVKNRKADYCAWPINEDLIHEDHVPIEIIEITEEEIRRLTEDYVSREYGSRVEEIDQLVSLKDFRNGAKAILSKLKGE